MAVSSIHDLLELGVNSNASDWHIKEGHAVVLRIAGSLVDTDFVPDAKCINDILATMAPPDMLEKYHETGDLDLEVEPANALLGDAERQIALVLERLGNGGAG